MPKAVVEAFNDRLREEALNEQIFGILAEAWKTIENWKIDCKTERPHRSLGGLARAVQANLTRCIGRHHTSEPSLILRAVPVDRTLSVKTDQRLMPPETVAS